MTEYNFVMMIIGIIMGVVFFIAWLATEEKRRNNAVTKYATANPQLRDDMINKIIRVGMSEERVASLPMNGQVNPTLGHNNARLNAGMFG